MPQGKKFEIKNEKVTRLCCLKSGGEYQAIHVQWLARQVPGLVCITVDQVDGVPKIKPDFDWPSWWCKMNAFSPNISGDILLIDLDTVVRGDIAQFERGKTTVLRDFYYPRSMGSGFMYVTEADRERVWRGFIADPERHMRECTTRARWGDQGFLQDYIGKADKWQDVMPGKVCSYKVHCRNTMPTADLVCFHGKPRPWQAKHSWIPPL